MRAVEAELLAAEELPDDQGGERLTYRELACRAYAVDTPNASQIAAVRRSAKRLADLGRAELWSVPRSEPFWRRYWLVHGVPEGAASRPLTDEQRDALHRRHVIGEFRMLMLAARIGGGLDPDHHDRLIELTREITERGWKRPTELRKCSSPGRGLGAESWHRLTSTRDPSASRHRRSPEDPRPRGAASSR
jgi:hypothetical protein